MKPTVIAFIGSGAMAGAIAARLTDAPYELRFTSKDGQRAKALASDTGGTSYTDNIAAIQGADIVMLAIKPQDGAAVCEALAGNIAPNAVMASLMAGVATDTLKVWLRHDAVSRIMPNTPAAIGAGMTGMYHTEAVGKAARATLADMMERCGACLTLADEEAMHAITALSGGGPAHMFAFLAAWQKAAMHWFSEEDARTLTLQTALGAIQLAASRDVSFATLIAEVCSPGGTTVEAIRTFEAEGLADTVARAVAASHARSTALAAPKAAPKIAPIGGEA